MFHGPAIARSTQRHSGQSQPADALANLQVAVDRNGSAISAKFPQTTDTAKLIAALPYLIKLKVTALDLSNSQIVTLPSLQGLSSLEKLRLHGSQVTTLLSLRGRAQALAEFGAECLKFNSEVS